MCPGVFVWVLMFNSQAPHQQQTEDDNENDTRDLSLLAIDHASLHKAASKMDFDFAPLLKNLSVRLEEVAKGSVEPSTSAATSFIFGYDFASTDDAFAEPGAAGAMPLPEELPQLSGHWHLRANWGLAAFMSGFKAARGQVGRLFVILPAPTKKCLPKAFFKC